MDENKALAEDMDKFPNEMSYRGKAYQQLVTDKDGKGRWEDQLAYDGRIEISWDGDTTGRAFFDTGDLVYKVSDLTPSKEEIIGGTFIPVDSEERVTITKDMIRELGNCFVVDRQIFVIPIDNFEADGHVIPEKGIYMLYVGNSYTNSLIYGKIKQLDEKFLPPASNQLLNAVFTRFNGDKSSITCNLTYEQIREQIENDLPILAIYKISEPDSFLITKYELDVNSIRFYTAGDNPYVLMYGSDDRLEDQTPE